MAYGLSVPILAQLALVLSGSMNFLLLSTSKFLIFSSVEQIESVGIQSVAYAVLAREVVRVEHRPMATMYSCLLACRGTGMTNLVGLGGST